MDEVNAEKAKADRARRIIYALMVGFLALPFVLYYVFRP
jgi:hypothetical protein